MSSSSRKNRLIALVGTITFHVVILILMCVGYMRYSAVEPQKWPPADSSEILYGGELVVIGDNNISMTNDQSTQSASETVNPELSAGDELINEGETGEPEQLISTTQESPAKVKKEKKPENNGPTKEEIAERERIRRERETAERIKQQVKFGNKGTGKGNTGSPDGNSNVGVANGVPGHSLVGRTLESFARPSSRLAGTLRIRVRVDRQGNVISASYEGGEGPASANREMRNRCIEASKQSRFSVSLDAQVEQVGVITWRFE